MYASYFITSEMWTQLLPISLALYTTCTMFFYSIKCEMYCTVEGKVVPWPMSFYSTVIRGHYFDIL